MIRTGLIVAALLFTGLAQAELEFPALRGRVVDSADMLSAATRQRVAALSAAHETATSNQVVVVTVPDLQGTTIEEFGYQLGRHWKIGQADVNNGVLLIVAKAERKIRIEVGYGLEGELTDAIASNIISTVITPAFKLTRFDEGVLDGTVAIIAALGGQYQMREPVGYEEKEIPAFWFLLAIVMLIWMSSGRGGGSGLLAGLLLGSMMGGGRGRGGGGFGGGFSGGGGSFGGGGASGSW